jgi:pimeloyl-ACP methyl ester carboxylesterase
MQLGLLKFFLYGSFIPFGFLLTYIVYFHYFFWTSHPSPESWNYTKHIKTDGISFKLIQTNGIKLNVGESGPKEGSIVIFLHGFPETGLTAWYEQVPAFVKANFRVIIPDLRGYNFSDKPEGFENYTMDIISDDIKGLIDHYEKKIYLVGHDWGAMVAWWVAYKYPQQIEKLVIINTGHPTSFHNFLQSSFSQMIKSSYMLYFVLPYIPDAKLIKDNFSVPLNIFSDGGIKGQSISSDAPSLYIKAWSQPNAMTSMLHYYRAAFRSSKMKEINQKTIWADPKIQVPTLILWGKKDKVADEALGQASLKECPEGSKLVYFDQGTHYMQHDEPERVNDEILEFFK